MRGPFSYGVLGSTFKDFGLYCRSRATEEFKYGVWQEDSELYS